MPVYEYVCEKCEHRFETLLRSNEEKPSCPSCKSAKLRKLFSVFGLNLGAAPGAGGGG